MLSSLNLRSKRSRCQMSLKSILSGMWCLRQTTGKTALQKQYGLAKRYLWKGEGVDGLQLSSRTQLKSSFRMSSALKHAKITWSPFLKALWKPARILTESGMNKRCDMSGPKMSELSAAFLNSSLWLSNLILVWVFLHQLQWKVVRMESLLEFSARKFSCSSSGPRKSSGLPGNST